MTLRTSTSRLVPGPLLCVQCQLASATWVTDALHAAVRLVYIKPASLDENGNWEIDRIQTMVSASVDEYLQHFGYLHRQRHERALCPVVENELRAGYTELILSSKKG